jgi:hypothetical protein
MRRLWGFAGCAGEGLKTFWTRINADYTVGDGGQVERKPISHRGHGGHREGKNVPAAPVRAKSKRLFGHGFLGLHGLGRGAGRAQTGLAQRRRGAEKGMFGRLRRKGKSAKNIGIRTRADPLALTGGTELDNGLERKIAFC